MTTVEELRLKVEKEEKKKAQREIWFKEEVFVADISFPPAMQQNLGITGFHMRLSDLVDFLKEEYSNENYGVFTVKIKKKTNKWVEDLPEADI
jgi:hypothetical protein